MNYSQRKNVCYSNQPFHQYVFLLSKCAMQKLWRVHTIFQSSDHLSWSSSSYLYSTTEQWSFILEDASSYEVSSSFLLSFALFCLYPSVDFIYVINKWQYFLTTVIFVSFIQHIIRHGWLMTTYTHQHSHLLHWGYKVLLSLFPASFSQIKLLDY